MASEYLIVTYDDYINIPYVKTYETYLQKHGVAYDMVLWDRSGQADAQPPNAYVFRAKDTRSKAGKLLPFYRWRRFVLEVLRKKQYDRLIIITTMPGVLLADQLLGRYRGRYWLDIRDYTYESIPLYKKIVGSLVKNAAAVSISSEPFRSFLPEGKPLILSHNLTNEAFDDRHCTLDPAKSPVTIGFVGGIQYVSQNQAILRQLKNHPRFHLKYVGRPHPGCDLQPFCQENGIRNVTFSPAYDNGQKPEIYRSIDLINCVYGSGNEIVQLALPNKLYDCVLYKKPMIVSQGTYLARLVSQFHLGMAVDIGEEDLPQRIEAYLAGFDRAEFESGCERFLETVRREQRRYENAVEDFVLRKEIYVPDTQGDPVL